MKKMGFGNVTNYRVVFTDSEGQVWVDFEVVNTNNFIVAENIIKKRIKKRGGGVLLRCDAWFED